MIRYTNSILKSSYYKRYALTNYISRSIRSKTEIRAHARAPAEVRRLLTKRPVMAGLDEALRITEDECEYGREFKGPYLVYLDEDWHW